MSDRAFDHMIGQARTVRLEDELARRGIKLRGRGVDRCGPCPSCGGVDRFSINLRKQVFNCRGHGGGDAIAMVQHLDGSSFKDAIATLTGERLPMEPAPSPPRRDPNQEDCGKRIGNALRIWNEASSVSGTLAAAYLTGTRCVDISALPEIDEVLRFHPRCTFGDERLPCLLALMRDIKTDEPIGIIRTAISSCGEKLDRKMFGRKAGAAVKLWPDATVTHGLVVGEGLETTARAATRIYRGTLLQPAWSLCDAGNLTAFAPLPGIEFLTILTDHDANRAGENAAEACARSWLTAGREVELLVPHQVGADFADLA
jgi:phage/plasmid primase-like uncharacterized protein